MAYLAFYRMFRPTSFDTVVRQEHIVKILKNQIETGKIGHAYLFCGPRGTGKTTLAKIFARAINCESPVDGSPCGKCATCKALSSGASLDISEIDAASNNGVDEMRDLREKVQYPPVNGKYKVYIIDEVHMLSQSAFNAVLKTLEEPPRHAVFILATTEPQKIPATILSRCMRFDFKLIPQADLEGLIKSVFERTGKEYEDEAVAAIARAGNGSARDSLSIADMCSSYSQGKLTYEDVNIVLGKADFFTVAEVVNSMLSGDGGQTLTATEQALSTGKGVGVLLRDVLTFLNNLAIVKMCKNAKQILNIPQAQFEKLAEIAASSNGAAILRATEILTEAEGDMRYAVDGRITLEAALLKAAMPETDYNIQALLARIEQLERQVKEGVKVVVKSQPVPIAPAPQEKPVERPEPVEPAKPVEQLKKVEPVKHIEEVKSMQPVKPIEEVKPVAPAPQPVSAKPELESTEEDNPFESTPKAEQSPDSRSEVRQQEPEQGNLFSAEATAPSVGSLTEADKSKVYGKLVRTFRTTRRNAIIFTLLSELDTFFEGEKFVLTTPSEQVYRSLLKEENNNMIAEALKELGVFSFEIRLKEKGEDKFEKALGELRSNFNGIDIDIK